MMKVVSLGSAVLVLLFAFDVATAQTCPPSESTSTTIYRIQYLQWPRLEPQFDVYDAQQHRWILRLTSSEYQGSGRPLELQGYQDVRKADLTAVLVDSWTGNSYGFHATGTFPPLGLRISPDFKWTTIYDVFMNGTTDDGSLKFNVSISYADFWTDSPANDLFSSKQVGTDYDLTCVTENSSSSGNNLIQTKGFWIAFDFDDGSHLYFNIPAGASAYVNQQSYSRVESCN